MRCWPAITDAARANASGRWSKAAATEPLSASSSQPGPLGQERRRLVGAEPVHRDETPQARGPLPVTGDQYPGCSACRNQRPQGLRGLTHHRTPADSGHHQFSAIRTAAPVSVMPCPQLLSASPVASATAASPVSRLAVSAPLTQATSRQPAASLALVYAAANCVAPGPAAPSQRESPILACQRDPDPSASLPDAKNKAAPSECHLRRPVDAPPRVVAVPVLSTCRRP